MRGALASGALAGAVGVALALSSFPAPAAQAPAAASPLRITVVGDSLTVGTLIYGEPSYLRRALHAASIRLQPRPSAKVGRGVPEGLRILARTRDLPRVVLIELGTNNWRSGSAEAARWIARARSIVGPDRDIYWVNLRMVGSRFASHRSINRGLLRGVGRDNAAAAASGALGRSAVLNWKRYSRWNGVRPGRDGIHYSPSGYRMLARFIAGSLAQRPAYAGFRIPRAAPAPTPDPTPTTTPPPPTPDPPAVG
jgi:lysophospholipase L1-like esterase